MDYAMILSAVAMLILLAALARVPAPTQYPMVTGGVMAVLTLLSCCAGERPARRELVQHLRDFLRRNLADIRICRIGDPSRTAAFRRAAFFSGSLASSAYSVSEDFRRE